MPLASTRQSASAPIRPFDARIAGTSHLRPRCRVPLAAMGLRRRLVLFAIARCPGIVAADLAAVLQLHETTIYTYIKRLVSDGWIVSARQGPNGARMYRCDPEHAEACELAIIANDEASEGLSSAPFNRKPGIQAVLRPPRAASGATQGRRRATMRASAR
jgi:hypothetical protein